MTTDTTARPKRKRRGVAINRSDWTSFGLYGVKYRDAMKVASDARRELVRRLAKLDAFLAMSEVEYSRVSEDRKEQPAKETLREIREWFDGEFALACRALGLDAGEVGEKAAICEIDHGYPRRQASIMAMREFLQFYGRYDGKVKEVVETGLILDLARSFIDERAMVKATGTDSSILRYTRPA